MIGGLQKSSFIDYPGKISCVLFLSGCNFDCPYCHNPELALGCPNGPGPIKETGVYKYLENRRGLLDGVVISGGEPTLDMDLEALCRTIKRIGYPVKLDTNGSRPRTLKRLINAGLVDYVAMDIKTVPSRYHQLVKNRFDQTQILESVGVIMEFAPDYEFRTTCMKPIVDKDVILGIVKEIKGARRYRLQGFHQAKMLNPEFFQGKDITYDHIEMVRFKTLAEPWVQECILQPAA